VPEKEKIMPAKKRYSAFEDLNANGKEQQKVQPSPVVAPETQPDATGSLSTPAVAASRDPGGFLFRKT